MKFRTPAYVGLTLFAFAGALYATRIPSVAAQKSAEKAPIFEVDPYWPKPLPNHWVTGSTIGI